MTGALATGAKPSSAGRAYTHNCDHDIERSVIVSRGFAITAGDQPVAEPVCQRVRQQLRLHIGDDLQTSGPDLVADRPRFLAVRGRCPDHIAQPAYHLGAEAFTGFYSSPPTTEMLATLHGGGHHALRILAAAASNSWIESTNSKNT